MNAEVTYPIVFELELDILHFLHETDEPKRFKEISSWILSQEKYSEKPKTIKTLFARALKNLEKEHVLKRIRRSHKFVMYNIKNRERAKLLLKLRFGEMFQLQKQTDRLLHQKTRVEALHHQTVLDFALLLLMYERILFEAILNDDRSFFIKLAKSGRDSLVALWDSLMETLTDRNKMEIRRFYTKNLEGISSDVPLKSVRIEKGTIFEEGSWIKAWEAHHYADLKLYSMLQSSFQECLSKIESMLRARAHLTSEEIAENALKGLQMLQARKLSQNEYDELTSMFGHD